MLRPLLLPVLEVFASARLSFPPAHRFVRLGCAGLRALGQPVADVAFERLPAVAPHHQPSGAPPFVPSRGRDGAVLVLVDSSVVFMLMVLGGRGS